jgi:hypothetical protein
VEEQPRPSRRRVVAAAGLAPLVSLAPPVLRPGAAPAAAAASKHAPGFRFFTDHEAAVIKAAAARLVPGPDDDPIEKLLDSPGATEAGVVHYIDTMLAAFDFKVPKIFAGGPYSDRHGGHHDYMAQFVPLTPRHRAAWKKRLARLRKEFRSAVKQLDAAAGGNFAAAAASTQDKVLIDLGEVRNLIFGHTIEGMYAVPEYGGNRGGAGWESIQWPGDSQPRGYTAQETERNDGVDVVLVTDLLAMVLDQLPAAASRMRLRGRNDV